MSLIFFKSFLWIVLLKYKPFFLLFHAVSSVNLLLYKQLPSKVKILSLVLIVYFIGLQLYSERKLYSSTSLISTTALHIEIISLVDGTYELIQEPDGDNSEARTNIMELTEVPNSNSEELKPTDFIDATEGKPWCIIPLF